MAHSLTVLKYYKIVKLAHLNAKIIQFGGAKKENDKATAKVWPEHLMLSSGALSVEFHCLHAGLQLLSSLLIAASGHALQPAIYGLTSTAINSFRQFDVNLMSVVLESN